MGFFLVHTDNHLVKLPVIQQIPTLIYIFCYNKKFDSIIGQAFEKKLGIPEEKKKSFFGNDLDDD